MSKIERRKFLRIGTFSTVAFISTIPCFNIENNTSNPSFGSNKKSKISAIKGTDLYAMTRDAIDALGGIRSFITTGDKVFIKPNFVNFPWAKTNNCFRNGECTKPEIIIATTEECLKAGASEVIIGEGSHLPVFDWQYALTFDRKINLVRALQQLSRKYKAKVSLACLENDSPGWVDIPSKTPLRQIAISSLVANADKVISLPVAKTHSWSQLSLAAKNFVGITPLNRYAQFVDNSWWNRGSFDHSSPQSIGQVFLDIVQSIKPVLSIVDFSIGIEGDGPTISNGGMPINMKDRLGSWAIIAGSDIMAVDATASRIMSHDVSTIKQLNMGFEMGLGEIKEESIEMIGEKLDNLRVPWKPAKLKGA